MSEALEFTGERFTPECVREIRYEHLHRYAWAGQLVRGLRVLDAACGEGYGSAVLARTAASVAAVDVSADAIGHARERYPVDGLEFHVADCLDLPFQDGEFDCVVSFETLEHLEEQERLLHEFGRVLKPGGFLLLSSPDKAVYTEQQQNRNEFHVRELYRNELESLVQEVFPAYRLWGQRLLFHSAIWSLEPQPGSLIQQETQDGVETLETPGQPPVYFIVICAREARHLPDPGHGLSLFDDAAGSVYEHYYHEIRKNMQAGELLAARDREIEALKAQRSAGRPRAPWWRRLFGGQ